MSASISPISCCRACRPIPNGSRSWNIRIEAEAEVSRAIDRYENERPGLGADFLD
jgi:hypothetical protein